MAFSGKKNLAGSAVQDKDKAPFILSEALRVVPAWLLKRIAKSDYVDMAELLKDNRKVSGGRVKLIPSYWTESKQKRDSRYAKLATVFQPICCSGVQQVHRQGEKDVGLPNHNDC